MWFIAAGCLVLGACAGFFVAALCVAASRNDAGRED